MSLSGRLGAGGLVAPDGHSGRSPLRKHENHGLTSKRQSGRCTRDQVKMMSLGCGEGRGKWIVVEV